MYSCPWSFVKDEKKHIISLVATREMICFFSSFTKLQGQEYISNSQDYCMNVLLNFFTKNISAL